MTPCRQAEWRPSRPSIQSKMPRRALVDLADQGLAGMPATTSNPRFRSRAEAALLEAKGDTAGALETLTEVEAAGRPLPEKLDRPVQLLAVHGVHQQGAGLDLHPFGPHP